MTKIYYINNEMTELAINMKLKQLNNNLKSAYKAGNLGKIELLCKQINKLTAKMNKEGVEV